MKAILTAIILVVALGLASSVRAQAAGETAPERPALAQGTLVMPKDPVVAMYLSATLPGLGQIYTGDKARGMLFMASVLGAFGAAYASPTKPGNKRAPLEIYRQARTFGLPVVAIGGITPNASAASITTFFGWPARPVSDAFGIDSSG